MDENKKNEEKDVFKEAAQKAAQKLIEQSQKATQLPTQTKTNEQIAKEIEEERTWDDLVEAVEGKYTSRFMDIMDRMPDREFVKNFMKMLEFFKPKVTRRDGTPNENRDTTINIQMVVINQDGEKEIITLNDNENDERLIQE